MFRKFPSIEPVLVGVCLLTVRRVFGKKIPTVEAYAQSAGISADTISRAARALRRPVVRCLRRRRPGPRRAASRRRGTRPGRLACHLALNTILRTLLPASVPRLLAASPAKRGQVVQHALHWRKKGVPFEELAEALEIPSRTLRRWMKTCRAEGRGMEVPHKSRRPHSSPGQLPVEIREALFRLRQGFPETSVAELTRIFNNRYRHLLHEHGWASLHARTAARYLRAQGLLHPKQPPPPPSSERGQYRYPPALTMAWVDTSSFTVAGTEVHLVGAMEAAGRIALAGDVFTQENTGATASVLALSLARVPGLAAVVRDRGKPYLNARIDEVLAAHGALGLTAHPYFPIDKAALERFFGTAKDWLHHALAPFEEECCATGRTPSPSEVVALVRPALRAFLRAYNLLPQPCIDGKSPLDRLDALLRGEGASRPVLDDFRKLALERETKDELLLQVRDGLQIQRTLTSLRTDFAKVSKTALERAIAACARKLFVERDPRIRSPYAYLRAVAHTKERAWQEEMTRAKKDERESLRYKQEQAAAEQAIHREEEQRRLHPEEVLQEDLAWWISCFRSRLPAFPRRAEANLRQTLQRLRARLGAAFPAQLAAAQALLPRLLQELRPGEPHLAAPLVEALNTLARPKAPLQPPSPPPPVLAPRRAGRAGRAHPEDLPCVPVQRLVRQVLGSLRGPHDGRTDVLS